jgi:hypothetical protein
VAQTEPSEETTMGVQEMRGVGEQKQEPSETPKAKKKRERKGGNQQRMERNKKKELTKKDTT